MDSNKKFEDFKNLWTMVSTDNAEALAVYCNKIVKDANNIISIYEGETCVATLSIPEMKFKYDGKEIPCVISSNLAIHPDYRHYNYELDLMFYALNHLYKKGIPLMCGYMISPKLKTLYQRRWHLMTTEARKRVHAIRPASGDTFGGIIVEKTTHNIDAEYNALASRLYHNYVVHPSATFDYMLMESDCYIARDTEGRTRGMAILLHYCEQQVITELLTDCEEATQVLVEEICKSHDWDYINYECYDKTSKEGMGLLRIINAQQMLELYAQKHPEWSDSFNIDDQHVIGNNGAYFIEQGHCRMMPESPSLRTIGISQLQEMIFDEYNINLGLIY